MKKKILIVDDSAPMRFLLEAMLGNKYKVYAATDGLTATMWLSGGNIPDLIITDVQMPNIDGWQLAKNLAGNALYHSADGDGPEGKHTPVSKCGESD